MGNQNEEKEITLDEKIAIRSIAPWNTGAARITSIGDIMIQANGVINLTREEVIAQVQSGNRLLSGVDARGTHATWYIEDAWTRKEIEFDVDENIQTMLSSKEIKRIFELKTKKSFEENIKKAIVTRAEKAFLMSVIQKGKYNDFDRIRFCEEHTGLKL